MTSSPAVRPTVAVIGGGVSGLTAAYLLQRTHHVTLFEADARIGGHAHTHDVTMGDGTTAAVDSGFIVLNDLTYPLLRRLFEELNVATRPTEMSMSVSCQGCGLSYTGGRGAAGVAETAALTRDAHAHLCGPGRHVELLEQAAEQGIGQVVENDEPRVDRCGRAVAHRDVMGVRMPADARVGLEERDVVGALQEVGGSETRHSATDDRDGGSHSRG